MSENRPDLHKAMKKNSFRRNLIEWLITLSLSVLILYFYAPASWWQFGVLKSEERRPTADFALKRFDAGDWNFSDQRGKVVVVNYWATWCGPCRFETPGLVNVATDLRSRGVEFVGVSVDDDLAKVPPFIEEYKINYEIVRPGNDPNAGDDLILPTTFLYDKGGFLAKKYTGIVLESTLRNDIGELLAE